MATRKDHGVAGFTLIEMVVSLILWGLTAALASQILITGFQAWMGGRVMAPLVAQGWIAMERMTRELGEAKRASLPTTDVLADTFATSIIPSDPNIVAFDQVPPAGGPTNAIYRQIGDDKRLLVDHVRAGTLQFHWEQSKSLLSIQFILEDDLFSTAETLQIPLQTSKYIRQ